MKQPFIGIMTATRYTQILDSTLLPITQKVFPEGCRLQQDNDPEHCARYTRAYLEEHDMDWWKTPAESPDLNPIENVWGSMKEYLRNIYKPRGLEDLKQGIWQFWKTLTPSVCTRYLNHLWTCYARCHRETWWSKWLLTHLSYPH